MVPPSGRMHINKTLSPCLIISLYFSFLRHSTPQRFGPHPGLVRVDQEAGPSDLEDQCMLASAWTLAAGRRFQMFVPTLIPLLHWLPYGLMMLLRTGGRASAGRGLLMAGRTTSGPTCASCSHAEEDSISASVPMQQWPRRQSTYAFLSWRCSSTDFLASQNHEGQTCLECWVSCDPCHRESDSWRTSSRCRRPTATWGKKKKFYSESV